MIQPEPKHKSLRKTNDEQPETQSFRFSLGGRRAEADSRRRSSAGANVIG